MVENHTSVTNLRNLIGTRARYHGVLFEIIEVLEDGPSLVLQDCELHTTIQADQHGEAHRRVPQTMTLHIPLTEEGNIDNDAIGLEFIKGDAEGNSIN